jgi:gas vesicle protein
MRRKSNTSRNILLTFLAGATAGAISLYLSKKENRKDLIDKYQESKNKIVDTTLDTVDDISYSIENFDKEDFINKTKENFDKINKDLDYKTKDIKQKALKRTQNIVKDTNKKIDRLQKKIQKKTDNLNK